MNVAPTFERTLMGSSQSKVRAEFWDQVLQRFEAHQYASVITGILDYVDPELIQRTANEKQDRFVIPHGSAIIHLHIDGGNLRVRAPFLSTQNARIIPLLRQVAQINFSPMNLSRIVLENEQLVFTYSSPLALCEPYKTYEVFREICFYADHFDDEFIQKFDASWIQEPVISPFTPEEKSRAWDRMQADVTEAFQYIEYFENKRSFAHTWEVLLIALMKIEYYCAPQGIFRGELQKLVEAIQEETPMIERIARGKEYLKKLQSYDRAVFEADLYRTQTFIPVKFRSTVENIRSNFDESYQQAKAERNGNDHLGATLTMLGIFYRLFYYNNVDDAVAKPIETALQKASGKTWLEASAALWEGMEFIMTAQELSNGPRRKGLWNTLFRSRRA